MEIYPYFHITIYSYFLPLKNQPMKKLYIGVLFFFGILSVSAQENKPLWQKDIKSSTQDFLTTMTSTIDGQILLSGSSINQKSQQVSTDNKQSYRG
ncbi:hypothetical protein QF004_002825, partial [Chryseobacterium sp. MDT2-18]|nr:hypothetical protein [Chryseobacterium sp. MDT2-18]